MKEIYLILDAEIAYEELFIQAKYALMGGVDKIQLVNAEYFSQVQIARLIELCHNYQSVLLFHESLEYAIKNHCDGVHFDVLPTVLDREILPNNFIVGVTVGNDKNAIQKAIEFGVDYITFSSLYPTNVESINSEIIDETAKKFKKAIYVGVGIKLEYLNQLKDWPITGVTIGSQSLEAENISDFVLEIKKMLGYRA